MFYTPTPEDQSAQLFNTRVNTLLQIINNDRIQNPLILAVTEGAILDLVAKEYGYEDRVMELQEEEQIIEQEDTDFNEFLNQEG